MDTNKTEQRKLVAGWSLTRMCNLKCKHCYSAAGIRDKNELSLEECFRVVDKLKTAGVKAINFGGGECALRTDFIKLCRYIHSRGIMISYTTNGTTFSRIRPHLHLFHDIGVSIDFADEKKHDNFRGRGGAFRSAVETLKELVKSGIENEMVTCLTKMNCSKEELSGLYRLAKGLGVDSWRLNRFRSNGRGVGNRDALALKKADLKQAYTFLSKFKGKDVLTPEPLFRSAFGGMYTNAGDPSGFTSFRIQHDGEVSPSVFLASSGGNIKEKPLAEIMDSDIFRAIRGRKAQGKCKKCSAYYHCQGGDAGASYLEYGHFNGPDPLCWLRPGDKKAKAVKGIKKNWNVHEMYLCTLYIPTGRKK